MVLFRLVFTILFASTLLSYCQETSVKPGINDNFEDPDIERLTNMFETESREVYRSRDTIVEKLSLTPGLVVADIGAGTGLFTLLMASKVEPGGKIIAVDIASELLDNIAERAGEKGVENVEVQLCDQKKTGLAPVTLDLAFVCDTYHHIEFPERYLQDLMAALKPGGRLVIVDFKKDEGVNESWVMGHVRLDEKAVIAEVEAAGFHHVTSHEFMKTQFMAVFEKTN